MLPAVYQELEKRAPVDPAKADLVKLRSFAGMTVEETAVALVISEPTAKRRWALAKAGWFDDIRLRGRYAGFLRGKEILALPTGFAWKARAIPSWKSLLEIGAAGC